MPITRLKKSSIKNFEFFRKVSGGFSLFGLGANEFKIVGDYFYHLFTSSGTFRLTRNGNFEVASIGAGGIGGYNCGGGGGGAELDTFFTISGTIGTYTMNVGSVNANNRGGDTIVSRGGTTHVTTLGGGNGGHHNNQGPFTGGSGGGASDNQTGASGTGANTSSGGNGKSVHSPGSNWGGGGGGGATGAGSNAFGSDSNNISSGAGGQGFLLTNIDSNLTSANFSSFSGMTRVSSGGSGTINSLGSSNTVGAPGDGAGSGWRPQGVDFGHNGSPALRAVSYGSGAGGGNSESAKSGIVIIRHAKGQ
jgi:hypothetical protein